MRDVDAVVPAMQYNLLFLRTYGSRTRRQYESQLVAAGVVFPLRGKIALRCRSRGFLEIFLSYKEVDAQKAIEIGKRLKNNAPGKVNVFVAADPNENPPGGKWRATIAKRLKTADVLILLYTNPFQEWGWCFYESGFFDGTKTTGETPTDLIVLYGPNVNPKASLGPLYDWQSIHGLIRQRKFSTDSLSSKPQAETGVCTLLRRLYVDTGHPTGYLQ